MPTLKEQGKEKVISRLLDAIDNVIEKSGVKVHGIGVGCPGPLDSKKGVILSPPNLPDWRRVPLKKIIERKFRLPVVIENDANCAGLGEAARGAGRRTSSMVLLTLGTGIGSAIVLDGKLWTGKGGFASELGHVSIDLNGPKCGCGNRGCIEVYASATAVVRRVKEALRDGSRSRFFKPADRITAAQIYRAAEEGDRLSRSIVDETAFYLGAAIANIINALDPEVIVLAGGMAKAGKEFFNRIRKVAKERALKESRRGVRIISAKLGEDAGIIGAAWRVRES